MSSQPLTKKQHVRLFLELMDIANEKMVIWTGKVADERAARDSGLDDMMLENAKLDADEDYRVALCNLHNFLLFSGYVPPHRG